MKKEARIKPSVVYRITNTLNGKFYIGVTTQSLASRFSQHMSCSRTKPIQGHFQRAIRKHGREAFIIEELAKFETGNDGLAAEMHFILEFKPHYNSTAGGEGVSGYKLTAEAKARISLLKRGNTYRRGSKVSDDGRTRMRLLGLANKEKFASFAHLGPQASSKRVVCLDDGQEFPSASAAAAFYGASKSAIIEVCLRNPRRASASGRVFRYVGDVFDAKAEIETARKRSADRAFIGSRKLKKPVVCVNDGHRYPSAIEASTVYGIHRSYIGEVCRGERTSAHGLVFQYIQEAA